MLDFNIRSNGDVTLKEAYEVNKGIKIKDYQTMIDEKTASESGGSVSCEAHRPIEELKKEYDDKFTLLIHDPKQPYRIIKIGLPSETLWDWIETEILKVR